MHLRIGTIQQANPSKRILESRKPHIPIALPLIDRLDLDPEDDYPDSHSSLYHDHNDDNDEDPRLDFWMESSYGGNHTIEIAELQSDRDDLDIAIPSIQNPKH
ncbi:hypothetical protein MKZ38_001403 [Zalerion maritima]|uniref:Uncharacterized protein n=1 Tax=Zalerion maritima TaxID=339359 RepID=A0AAD5RRA4_9PEZI|nr:hypothetical protein MKZ38_001403 [Zalerion maritima]